MIKFGTTLFSISMLFLTDGVQSIDASTCQYDNPPPPGGALEILDMQNCNAYYTEKRDRPDITNEMFKQWSISIPFMSNPLGVRYVNWADSCLYASPGHEGEYETKLDINEPWPPANWFHIANFCSSDLTLGACFPEPCNSELNPNPGSLKINHVAKCHSIVWKKGQATFILTDPDGNKYILGSTTTLEQSETGVMDPAP
mmetsp:Transcript_25731/g.18209  ORF Transcript_25731/g.18209 Transcript_25731/m.18209 type:complete len:200 (+) Transcript_25731:42-641(+)